MEGNLLWGEQSSKQTIENNSKDASLLSMIDMNIVQNIFVLLVEEYKFVEYEEDLKSIFELLSYFKTTSKLFLTISKQPLFPLILNNINITLNCEEYLKIKYIEQQVKKNPYYKEKDINDIFRETCSKGYYTIIDKLIKYGANLNQFTGTEEHTGLIVALNNGNVNTVKKLVSKKQLNINLQNEIGLTPLIDLYIYVHRFKF